MTAALAWATLVSAAWVAPACASESAVAPESTSTAAPRASSDLAPTGDAERGRAIVANRSLSLCVLCHAVPGQPAHAQGDIGPPLDGVGARLDAGQLRLRLLAPQRFNPDTVMPAYGPREGLVRVAARWRDQPLLSVQQVDDVVAWLASLR